MKLINNILFLVYINDIVMGIDSTIKLFAADAIIYRAVQNQSDSTSLQNDLQKLEDWSTKWLLKFNENK